MGLFKYLKKRNFDKTTEPEGKNKPANPTLKFCVQEHHASHHHFDFRLEVDGVLKSWAVPKGPPKDSTEKRLAIHVEDHPFDYLTFEGTIPKGNYGAGTVTLWDIGVYEAEGATTAAGTQTLMKKGLKNGHIDFVLHGKQLCGSYSLVRMHNTEGDNQWLFLKKKF